jgi:oxidoreductase, FAD-dependent
MCPGGYVVNASSEEGHLAVNGMSYYKRDSKNANSAVIITIDPSDYGDGTDPLSGVAFQRELERRAYLAGNGRVPVERLGTFREAVLPGEADEKTDVSGTDASQPFDRKGKCAEHVPPDFSPCIKGAWAFGKVHDILPKELSRDFVRGMEDFSRVIPGFSDSSVLIEGVESRTSSPVRILRDERLESDIRGLFPCGEGAGYAGGITSAAMDGIKVAEEIAGRIAYGEQKQDAQTGYQK